MNNSITVSYRGIDFEVHYDYQPEEKEVRYYSDGSGYPGCAESLDITSVEYAGEEWIYALTPKALDEIEQSIYDMRNDYSDFK